jgi:hypothetical protein
VRDESDTQATHISGGGGGGGGGRGGKLAHRVKKVPHTCVGG